MNTQQHQRQDQQQQQRTHEGNASLILRPMLDKPANLKHTPTVYSRQRLPFLIGK